MRPHARSSIHARAFATARRMALLAPQFYVDRFWADDDTLDVAINYLAI
jgi:hypothetical protein